MQGEASTRLGFTDYLRVELAWAKLLGAMRATSTFSTIPVKRGACEF